jgi:Dolichyl-phosphate-mannose-protein mannosyltransferase
MSSASRLKVGLWFLGFFASALACYPLLASLSQPGPELSDYVIEDFRGGQLARPERLMSVNGFEVGGDGWYLAPGESGQLRYRVPGGAGGRIGLTLSVNTPAGVTSTVFATGDDGVRVVLASDVTLYRALLSLPSGIATSAALVVEFDAHNGSSRSELVVGQLSSYIAHGSDPRTPPFYVYVAVGVLSALLTMALVRDRIKGFVVAAGMGALIAVAAYTRFTALFATHGPLEPDALEYRLLAESFRWSLLSDHGLFSGNFGLREPFFPLVVHAVFQVLGTSDFHLRAISATLSISVVVLTVLAARRQLRSWPARLAVGFLVAASSPLIGESSRGLRTELEMCLLLLAYIALDRRPARRPILDAVLVGVIGAALVLTRTYFIPVVGIAIAISFLARYRPSTQAMGLATMAFAIVVGAAAAHRVGLYEHNHDAFVDTSAYARWNANYEYFIYHRSLPHRELFPTLAEYESYGLYYGPHLTTTQYLFDIHSPAEVVRGSLIGYGEVFQTVGGFHLLPGRFHNVEIAVQPRVDFLIRWLLLVGLAGLLFRARRDPLLALIPVLIVGSLAFATFLFDRGLVEPYRHTWQTLPLGLIAGGWAVESALAAASSRFNRRPATAA